jgi:hypothetical protein
MQDRLKVAHFALTFLQAMRQEILFRINIGSLLARGLLEKQSFQLVIGGTDGNDQQTHRVDSKDS